MDITNFGTAMVSSGITLFLAKFFFTWQFKKIEHLEKEQKEIKENYLDRFEKVMAGIGEIKEQIVRLDERFPKRKK